MPRTARPWFSAEKGWWMVHHGGKKVRLARGRKNKKLAELKHRELLHLRDSNPAPEAGQHTVASVIDLYLEHAKRRYAERSLYERRLLLQAFAEAHGFRTVNDRDCLPFHLTSWLDAHPEWGSDWTKAHVVAVIQRPFNWAAKQRLIACNPFRGVSHRPGEPRRPLTDAEFRGLLKAAERKRKFRPSPGKKKLYPSDRRRRMRPSPGARFRQLVVFLRFTGARPGEASKLKWEHVDCENAVIVLPKHKTSRTQRQPRPRVIPLHPVVVKLLIHIRRRSDPGEFVFLTHRKTPWNRSNLSLRLCRARERAGIPPDAKLYGLRHAYGTRAIVNGVDIKTLAELLGHTTTRMAEHYVHLAGQRSHLHRAVERVNAPAAPPAPATPAATGRSPSS
jgi:integrase